ncbi:MAG TPA: O-antigen ligase family protein [Solirubrobacteraceae bacterium]|jgi:hypothetical protein|nr:O-antigen ligase family protein [Solirubrobacteraceae bacterium]
MLANQAGADEQSELGRVPVEPHPAGAPGSRRRLFANLLAFAGGGGLVLVYALRGSGSYDNVVFGEHGLVIWWVLALGIAFGVLPRARPSRELLWLLGALFAYGLWTALSLTWSQSSELTSQELARTLSYLGLVALVGAVLDRTNWRAGALGVGTAAIVVCVLAVFGRLAPSVFPHDNLSATLGTDRLSWPFGYWNAVGAWGAMSIALGLAWSAHDTARIRRALALALVPVAGAAVYLSYSRAGTIGAGVAVVAVIVCSRHRFTAVVHVLAAGLGTTVVIFAIRGAPAIAHATGSAGAGGVFAALAGAAALCAVVALLTVLVKTDRWRLPRRALRPLAVVLVVVIGVPGVVLAAHFGQRAWNSFTRTPVARSPLALSSNPTARFASLASSRYPLWKSALTAWEDHPFDGTGAGTWPLWWNQHGTDGEYTRNTHNLWLENLAELGAPGLVLIVAVALAALAAALAVRRRVRRSVSAGAGAAMLAGLVVYLWAASVDWMWQSTAVTVLALALAAAATVRLSDERFAPRWWWRALLAVVAGAIGAFQIPVLLSTAELRHSQSAAAGGHTALAISWAGDAISAEPWSASAYEQRALLEESIGRFDTAAVDERRAIIDEPTNYAHWLVMARIQTERGQLPLALSDYNRAQQLRPLANVFRIAPYLATPGHLLGILP